MIMQEKSAKIWVVAGMSLVFNYFHLKENFVSLYLVETNILSKFIFILLFILKHYNTKLIFNIKLKSILY